MRVWSSILSLVLFSTSASGEIFHLRTNREPLEKLSVTIPPFTSLVLPGLDQWWEGQYQAATVYSATALLGLGLAAHAPVDFQEFKDKTFSSYDRGERQYTYGLQLYQSAGSLSAFHSFRTAVKTRQDQGQFLFLSTEETPADLLKAPFEVNFLLRPTTYVPLLAIAGLNLLAQHKLTHLNLQDAAFNAGVSYNAGVGEEALFRGYLMPLFREGTGSDFWSNTLTATFFGLAHYSPANRFPIVQGAVGWYLGWLTERNHWSLRQAVFVHTWWDLIAIGFSLADQDEKTNKIVRLPTFTVTF